MTRPMRIVSSKKSWPRFSISSRMSIDVRDSEFEIAHQVRLVDRELPLDLVERREVVLQQRGALARPRPHGDRSTPRRRRAD